MSAMCSFAEYDGSLEQIWALSLEMDLNQVLSITGLGQVRQVWWAIEHL
jgi:hypothetical protein